MDFSFLSKWWDAIAKFFTSIWDYFYEAVVDVICWFFDLYTWLSEESYNLCINAIVDLLEGCTDLIPDTPYDRQFLIELCEKINVFFPLDLFFKLLLTLLSTWIAVKLYKLGIRVSIHFIRRQITKAFERQQS